MFVGFPFATCETSVSPSCRPPFITRRSGEASLGLGIKETENQSPVIASEMGRDRDHHRSNRKKSKKKSSSKSESKESRSSTSSGSKLSIGSLQHKLKSLNNTQDSVQSVSLWIIHHKHHVTDIVATWLEEIKNTAITKRLILMYLANDVIQNSRRKGITAFVDGFGDALVEAVSFCRDDSIRKNIERLFKIWEQRNVYDSDAVERFQDAISTEKDAQAKANAEILAEYKPDELPDSMEKFVHFEGEVDLKRKQLSNMNVDVTSTEAIMQLKDRAGGKRFSKHFEDATNKLDDYVQSLGKEVEMRQGLEELLEKSVVFYEAQFGEAKIVANAYKNFGTRVSNLKKRLDEYRKLLPNDSISPIPSPTSDAPSPGATPPRDPNQDTTELEDMEMSDDDMDSKHHVGSVVATTSGSSRNKSVTSSKKQAPLASLPGPPIVGQPISIIAGQVGKYADETQESYSPGSNASAPSPVGTPEGLNLSPSSSQTAQDSNIYGSDIPAQATASYQATAQNLLPQIPSPVIGTIPTPVDTPLPTTVAPVPPVSYTSTSSSSTYSMYTQSTSVQYSSTYAPPVIPTVSTPQSAAPYSSNTYYQSETAGSTGYSATPIDTSSSQPTTPSIYSQNYTPSTYNAPQYYGQQASQEGGYSTAQTSSHQYNPPPAKELYSPTMPTSQQFTATNSYNPTVPPPNYGTNYAPTAPNPPPPIPQSDYKPAPPPVEETFTPSSTQYTPREVNYSEPQHEYQTPSFPSGSESYDNAQSCYGTENYQPYDNQSSSYPGNDNGYQQTGYSVTDESHTGFNSGSTLEGRDERELMQQAKTNPIGFLTRIITASKQPRTSPRSNLLNNLTALKTVPTVDDETFKTKSESEQKLRNNASDQPSETDEEKSTGSLGDNQDGKEMHTKPRSILKRRQAPEVLNIDDVQPPKREKMTEPKIKSSHSIALGAFLSSLKQDDDDDEDEEDEQAKEKLKNVHESEPKKDLSEKSNVVLEPSIKPKTVNSTPNVDEPRKTIKISTIKVLGDQPPSGPSPGRPPGPPPGPPPANAKRGPLNISPTNPVKSLAKDTDKEAPKCVNVEPTSPIPVLGAPIAKPVLKNKRRLSSVIVPAKNYSEDTNDWEANNSRPDYRGDHYPYESMDHGHDRGRYDDYRQRRRSMEMDHHRHQPYGGDRYEDNRYRYNRGPPFHDYGPPEQHRLPVRGGRPPPVRGGRPPPYYRY